MKKYFYLVLVFSLFFALDVFAESGSDPDEYRDCAVYKYDQVIATTSANGNNIVSFTFSDKVSRVAGTNADCNVVEEEEETPETPSGGSGGGSGDCDCEPKPCACVIEGESDGDF